MKIASKLVLLGLGLSASVSTAQAGPITFAQFDLGSGLIYTDNGANSTVSETSQINLTCLDPACSGVGSQATLTFSAVSSGQAGSIFGGAYDVQSLGAGTITVTLATPYDGKTNFLTIDFTGGSITGFANSPDVVISNSGSSTFSSDFLTGTDAGFQLNLTDASPGLGIDDGGYLQSFAG